MAKTILMSRTYLQWTRSEPWIWRHEWVWRLSGDLTFQDAYLTVPLPHPSFLLHEPWDEAVEVADEESYLSMHWRCARWESLSLNFKPIVLLNSIKLMSFDGYIFCLCLIFFIQLLMGVSSNAFQDKWRPAHNFQLHWKEKRAGFRTFTVGTKT